LLERFRVLVWGGGALLGWVAGDIMATDPAVIGWVSEATAHQLHLWGGRIGALIVIGAGYVIVRRHRPLILDEILAGVGLVIWIVGDIVTEHLYGGASPDLSKIWMARGIIFLILLVGYAVIRSRSHGPADKE
jgi:predicted tellurium resistance membrane protein TerC